MEEKFTLTQFLSRFPDNDACLEEIKRLRWGDKITCPKCGKDSNFYRVKGRTAYACQFCGHHLYPLAETIFDKSTTPLTSWFYAIYLMAQTRAGISAKQLQRELGVTYKTAWRMFHQIRKLLADDNDKLSGEVEVDEAYIGGNPQNRRHIYGKNIGDKAIILGMVERKGRARIRKVPSSGTRGLVPEILNHVSTDSWIFSDEHGAYKLLYRQGYNHSSVNHRNLEYVKGNVHTQNVENFWSNLKRGITGVYRHVDPKYLQAYADEYAFRYSHRNSRAPMFDLILNQVAVTKIVRA